MWLTESTSSVFFFSSRRRHTRCLSDWSSDVCSSDLVRPTGHGADRSSRQLDLGHRAGGVRAVDAAARPPRAARHVREHAPLTMTGRCAYLDGNRAGGGHQMRRLTFALAVPSLLLAVAAPS